MWKEKGKAPVLEYLGWLLLVWGVCKLFVFLLDPYASLYAESGKVTLGYVVYAIIGLFFSTPSPMIATYIILKRHKKIGTVKDFCKLILQTPNVAKAVIITLGFCFAALCAAIIYWETNKRPWYLLIMALPVMILGGGVEEIGGRGFLQPELEKRFSFPVATILVAVVWILWHCLFGSYTLAIITGIASLGLQFFWLCGHLWQPQSISPQRVFLLVLCIMRS